MDKQLLRYLQLPLLLLDTSVLNVIIVTSNALFSAKIAAEYSTHYFRYLIFSNVSWLILSWIGALYSKKAIATFEAFSKRTSHIYILWLCSLMIYLLFYRQFELSRFFLISSLLIFGFGLFLNRFVYLGIRDYYRASEHLTKNIIILGYNKTAKELVSYLEEEDVNTNIVGFIEDPENIKELTHYPVLSSVNDILEVSKKMHVNEIFSTITPEQDNKIYEIMQQAESECIRFKIIPDLSFFIRRKVHIEYLKDMPIIFLRHEPLEDVGNRAKKRALDLVVSFLVITFILSWVVPIIALFIYLESKGPVFFGQLRSGKNNKGFTCWKFRSMRLNSDKDNKQTSRNDNRLTRVGKFIRKTSLDEFPQFYNVLKGEMSIVGPRPHMIKHTKDFAKIVNHYMLRQFLKPGITGWAQVNGFRGEVCGNEQIISRVEYDIWYSENWSMWLDVKIIFLTIYNVFKGDKNAY